MAENKLSGEEIGTALECCIDSKCDECPYTKKNIDCSGGRQERDCIELINTLKCNKSRDSWKNKFLRQLQEKEKLQKQVDELNEYCKDMYKKAVDREEDAYSLGFDKGREQAVKDTAKEIGQELADKGYFEYGKFIIEGKDFMEIFRKRGVDLE